VICGVDEAGKGSVLGPLVIAAVGVTSEDIFSELKVRDSKLLTAAERERLYSLIRKCCKVASVSIDAHEIDVIRTGMTLNTCIARAHADVIDKLMPEIAYVDACDVNEFRYGEMVKNNLSHSCEIVAEHHADKKFPVVSAASIVAKVTRDRAIRALSKKYGDIGSGYPSDPITIRYLNEYIDHYRHPPAIARKSWKTVITMMGKKEQSDLSKFF